MSLGATLCAAAARLGPDAPRVLARIAGPLGDDACAAWAEGTRAATRGALPAGLEGAHASWLAAAPTLAPQLPRDVWLARRACARIPPLPPIAGARRRPASLDEALALSAAQLREWLVGVGIDQLVFALGPGAALDDLIRRAPRAATSASRVVQAPRTGQLGPRRAAIARSTGALDDTLPLRIGARAIAPHVARRPLARAQLRSRLSVAAGTLIDAELRAHAADPVDQAPTWLALGAP